MADENKNDKAEPKLGPAQAEKLDELKKERAAIKARMEKSVTCNDISRLKKIDEQIEAIKSGKAKAAEKEE